jgi:two-component system OmpR family response regulator
MRNLRVLIVDDEVRIRVNVARVLSKRGFLMDMAGNLAEAREMLDAQQYDAVLLDWQLPDGSGIELCPVIRAQHPMAHVLMLTARDEPRDRLRAFDAGADDYVIKQDIDFEEVGARLRAVSRRRASSSTLAAVSAPPSKSGTGSSL